MEKYLFEIEVVIKKSFKYIKTWNNEIKVLPKQLDTTFMITKKNFVIVWLNSINESLLENIILLYYDKYFKLILKETNHYNYTQFELSKIQNIIKQNHDGSFNWFSNMLSKILWNIIWNKQINKKIKKDFSNWSDFNWKLTEINELRNKIWHNSEFYFQNDQEIKFELSKLEEYIDLLENWFIELSKIYYTSMNDLLSTNSNIILKKWFFDKILNFFK